MGKSVFEVEQWPAAHIAEWRDYFVIEPFGAIRDNMHAAMITAAIVNAFRAPKTAAVSADDFMLRPAAEVKKREAAKHSKLFDAFAAKVNAIGKSADGK